VTWEIIGYTVGVLFNLAVVAGIRAKAYDAGTEWLQSGRFAVVAVFVLAFLELLVTGRFEALRDARTFADLIQQAWVLAGGSVGVHAVGKTVLTGR